MGDDKHQSDEGLSPQAAAKLQALAKTLKLPLAVAATTSLGELVARMDSTASGRDAPVRELMARMGDRWSTLILLVLNHGTLRHATLRRTVAALSNEQAISQRMLTLRLRALERDGLVARQVMPTVPPQVDYSLTPMGRDFIGHVDRMLRWIENHHAAILVSRDRFEAGRDQEQDRLRWNRPCDPSEA